MTGRGSHYNVNTRFELTPRQQQVLDLVARGKTNGEIAEALEITLDGVKWHVREILAKLEVESRDEAAAIWRDHQRPARRLGRALGAIFGAGMVRWAVGATGVAVVAGVSVGAYTLIAGSLTDGSPVSADRFDACDTSKIALGVEATDNPAGTVDITANFRNEGPPCVDQSLSLTVRHANDDTSPVIARVDIFDVFPGSGPSTSGPIEWRNYCGSPGPFDVIAQSAGVTAITGHAQPPACEDPTAAASTLGPPPALATGAVPDCDPSNVQLRVEPNVAGDNVVFFITVDNSGPRCHVDGTLALTLGDRDGTGIANAVRNNPDAIPINLDVDTAFGSNAFAWENWCGPLPPHSFSADASIDNRIGSSPSPPVPPPKCVDSSQQSQIRSVQAASLFNGGIPLPTPTP